MDRGNESLMIVLVDSQVSNHCPWATCFFVVFFDRHAMLMMQYFWEKRSQCLPYSTES